MVFALYFRISLELRALLNGFLMLPDYHPVLLWQNTMLFEWAKEGKGHLYLALCVRLPHLQSLFFFSICDHFPPTWPSLHLPFPLTFVSLTVNPFLSLSTTPCPFLFFPPPCLLPSIFHSLHPPALFNFSYSWKTQVLKIAPISNM